MVRHGKCVGQVVADGNHGGRRGLHFEISRRGKNMQLLANDVVEFIGIELIAPDSNST